MNTPPKTEPSTEPAEWTWQNQMLLATILALVAFTGWTMRQAWVKPKQDQLKSVERLMDVALDVHNSHVERYAASIIDQDAIADGIERKTLPIWAEALAKAEGLTADGVTGGSLDVIIDYLRLRRDASEQLMTAITSNDDALLERSKETWQASNAALEKLKPSFGTPARSG